MFAIVELTDVLDPPAPPAPVLAPPGPPDIEVELEELVVLLEVEDEGAPLAVLPVPVLDASVYVLYQ
jgi:hypothetical protein